MDGKEDVLREEGWLVAEGFSLRGRGKKWGNSTTGFSIDKDAFLFILANRIVLFFSTPLKVDLR